MLFSTKNTKLKGLILFILYLCRLTFNSQKMFKKSTQIIGFSAFILFLSLTAKAQFAEQYCFPRHAVAPCDSNKLYFSIANANFLKDNEYFNNIVEGYTLMGYWITPTVEYHPSAHSVINGGIHLLKFTGRDNFFQTLPVLSFTQQFNPIISLTFGTLQFNGNHNMPEPLLDPERFYFQQAQNGVQILIDGSRFKSDIWVTWDHFIWYGDTDQEKISSGTSSELEILKGSQFSLVLPFQTIITHHGGQINSPKVWKPIETLINLGSGFYADYRNEDGYLKLIRLSPQFFLYKESTSYPYEPYRSGWAVFPNILVNAGPFLIKAGWWYTDKFIGPLGEAIYQSISTPPGYDEVHRNLLIGKIGYSKKLAKGIIVTGGFEGYYDQHLKQLDYNFSISLHYNEKFLVASF
jgi:hypothetical protein